MSEQAGREMDARVAEKVMGTPKYWSVWFACSHYGNFNGLDQAQVYAEKIQGDFKAHVIPYGDEPAYSTSIAAAWEVVTALEHKSLFLTLSRNQIPNDANGQQSKWDVLLWDNGKQVAHNATADTAPLAICKAALKAVGAEGDE